jgi:hypothetical protein
MVIIKAPPKQPKSVTVQARVEESVKEQLDMYAKFIDSTPNPRSKGVPGYRDRVVHIGLEPEKEGGLNLDMSTDTIDTLTTRGRKAGGTILSR